MSFLESPFGMSEVDAYYAVSRSIGVPSRDLESPLFDVPLSRLRDLWLAKHGNAWVAEKNAHATTEGRILLERLKGVLEAIYVQDKMYTVYRIAPD